MFATPRPKKSILPPAWKKRKSSRTIEEIAFNPEARYEYLTGFHKRKQQRIQHAQKIAAEKARQERLNTRKQIREDRQRQLEDHVQHMNSLLREAEVAGHESDTIIEDGEWDGIEDAPNPAEFEDQEQEYIDEDRFTTVLVESVSVSRDGLYKPSADEDSSLPAPVKQDTAGKEAKGKEPQRKSKKKQFRYESKHEREFADRKQRLKKKKMKLRGSS